MLADSRALVTVPRVRRELVAKVKSLRLLAKGTLVHDDGQDWVCVRRALVDKAKRSSTRWRLLT